MNAVYRAPATAAETTTLVVSNDTTTVTIASATYTSVAQQVTAIQGGTDYGDLLFTVAEASGKFEMTYKTAGPIGTAPTVTGESHTVSVQTAGVTAVNAVYRAPATAAETTTLVVSDGTTTVNIADAAYTSVAQQVTAIQGGTGYSSLLFTVAEASGKFEMTYKTAGAIATAPTFSGAQFIDVNGGETFKGNVNYAPAGSVPRHVEVRNTFTTVQARQVKILPQTWSGYINMRAGVLVASNHQYSTGGIRASVL